MNADGTRPWPHDLSPVDRVGIALADVARARHHVITARRQEDEAINELSLAVGRLMQAARGDHT